MYEKDLALNNLQELICHKNQPNQAKQRRAIAEHIIELEKLIKISELISV